MPVVIHRNFFSIFKRPTMSYELKGTEKESYIKHNSCHIEVDNPVSRKY